MMQGPFSNIKLELEDIPSEAYFFNEEDKKFWCTKCNYSTPRLDKVIQHIKAHLYSKWRCDECGKAFIKVSYTQLCIKISLMKVSMPIKHRCSYAQFVEKSKVWFSCWGFTLCQHWYLDKNITEQNVTKW